MSTIRVDIKHRTTGAVLFPADVDASIDESFRINAALRIAVKARAYLADAYLADANLAGANLADANLAAQLGHPNGWHAWTYIGKDGVQRVRVGCQDKTIAEGRAYWANKPNRREVLAAIDYAEQIATLRGWFAEAQKVAA